MRPVSDHRSNPKEQIEHAVDVLGQSAQRKSVFEAIYKGKRAIKTVPEIAAATGLTTKRILTIGKRFADTGLVTQMKVGKNTAYQKDSFYASQKTKILGYVANPKKFEKLATKSRPHLTVSQKITHIAVPTGLIKCKHITVDEIDSFAAVRAIDRASELAFTPMLEAQFKGGVKRLLNESSSFKDWGGETNDLLTTRVKFNGSRLPTAFAFKGRGRTGKLTPSHMGKNGDQLLRLFKSPARLYVVQYWGEIDQSVIEHVEAFAQLESVKTQSEILFCVIDGVDSTRLIESYPNEFGQ